MPMTVPVEATIPSQAKPVENAKGSPQLARRTSSSLIARNATLNLLTQGWIFLVLLVAMPKLVSYLGEGPFGLFSLAWVIIGYLSFLDVGVNRAATKFVSEYIAEQDHESMHGIVRTALISNLSLGLIGGLAFALISPYLIHSIFKLSNGLENQARWTFYAVALAVPVLLVQGIFRAVLSSFQRFGWINVVDALASTAQWGVAGALAWRGYGVALVVFSTVVARMVATVAYGIVMFRLVPDLQLSRVRSLHGFRELLHFGGWVTVSQVISPILVYLDRVMIASFVSLGAVALYTVPYEAMFRLRIIPLSLANVLYPAFSERGVETNEAQLQRLYEGSVRYLLLIAIPPFTLLGLLGKDLLSLWMSRLFASQASAVLEILALGVFLNALACIPYNALQALGRPDLTGQFHLLELPVYILLCVVLIPRWGIVGAAIANSLRLAIDALLLFWAARRYHACSVRFRGKNGFLPIVISAVFLLGLIALDRSLLSPEWARLGAGVGLSVLYFSVVWGFVLSERERPTMTMALSVFRRVRG
jgi:O-antigen/teichoic acid export membrane protein